MRRSLKKELKETILSQNEALSELPVGSEEQLNACKALNQLTEADGRLNRVDWNALIPAAGSILMFLVYMGFSDTHITDTRGIQFCKSLFRK